MKEKIEALCRMITEQSQERLTEQGLGCEANLKNQVAHSKDGNKYTKVDRGGSGFLMIENSTGMIFGIKAYGQIHRGHSFGTLDTIGQWDWSNFYPVKRG